MSRPLKSLKLSSSILFFLGGAATIGFDGLSFLSMISLYLFLFLIRHSCFKHNVSLCLLQSPITIFIIKKMYIQVMHSRVHLSSQRVGMRWAIDSNKPNLMQLYLSKGGRLLLKSTLSNLPTAVANRIEKLFHAFFLGWYGRGN